VNLRSYFFAAQAVIPGMVAAGGGAIVNFSSISYMIADAGYLAYITANAGIVGMTRSLAREFGRHRIRVNALAPGWVMTPKQKEMWATPEGVAEFLKRQCLPDGLEPEDIVGGVLFLSSNTSRMMTGQSMVIDGGVVVTG
jgi:galactose dehydrogenase